MRPYLIARPHPELARIDSLYVTVAPLGAKAEEYDPIWKELGQKVGQKLQQAGIKVLTTKPYDKPVSPQLGICIDLLKLDESNQRVFHVQTSLSRMVYPEATLPNTPGRDAGLSVQADVWNKSSPMQIAASQHTAAAITQIVLQQTEELIVNWTAANPPGKQAADANDIKTVAQEPSAQPTKSPPPRGLGPAEYKYVASKNSTVFHLPGCSSAARISSGNLVGYKTRDEAINAGKRPCKLCKP
jgi:hypothetical protein